MMNWLLQDMGINVGTYLIVILASFFLGFAIRSGFKDFFDEKKKANMEGDK